MDRIEIRGLEIFAYHGVEEQEKLEGQKFYIDAILYCNLRDSGKSDELNDTINYAIVCEFIDDFLKENRFDLIEAAAEQTVMALLKRMPKLRRVDFTIHKPSAPIGLPFEDIDVSITRMWHKVYLSIGSNMGEKQEYLNHAVESFYDDDSCRVLQISKYIETEPYGPIEQDNFLNGCVELETLYTPQELLTFVNEIESIAGRTREVHWGPRTLDIDIILYDDEIIYEPKLIIPHKEMHKRAFVLVPLNQIAPYAVNPVLNKSVSVLLKELSIAEKKDAVINECEGCGGCCKGK